MVYGDEALELMLLLILVISNKYFFTKLLRHNKIENFVSTKNDDAYMFYFLFSKFLKNKTYLEKIILNIYHSYYLLSSFFIVLL